MGNLSNLIFMDPSQVTMQLATMISKIGHAIFYKQGHINLGEILSLLLKLEN